MLTFLKKFLSLRPKTIPEKPEVPHTVEALPAGAATVPAVEAVIVVPDAVVPAAAVAKPKAPAKPKAEPKPRTPKAAAK